MYRPVGVGFIPGGCLTAGRLDDDDRRLDAAVRAAVRADQRPLTDHPSAQQLAHYSLGLHGPEEEGFLQEHLSSCVDCTDVVLGLMDSAQVPAGTEALAQPELDQEWARLHPVPHPPAPDQAFRPGGSTTALAWGLAALLVVCAGLLSWALRLHSDLAHGLGPSAAVVLADLEPERAGGGRGADEAMRLQRPPAGRLVLLLNLGDLRTFPRYRIELTAERGEVLWRTQNVRRSDVGTFVLDLPAERLGPGAYEVRLYGIGSQGESRLAVYRFDLVE
jgi:hypothetical protein